MGVRRRPGAGRGGGVTSGRDARPRRAGGAAAVGGRPAAGGGAARAHRGGGWPRGKRRLGERVGRRGGGGRRAGGGGGDRAVVAATRLAAGATRRQGHQPAERGEPAPVRATPQAPEQRVRQAARLAGPPARDAYGRSVAAEISPTFQQSVILI